VFRVEAWRISRVPDKSLARTVYQIFSDVNGLFTSSDIECKDEMEKLRPGTDESLRTHAKSCLKNNIGWTDNVGRLVEGGYPKVGLLFSGLKQRNSPAPASQPFLSPNLSPMVPEPEAVARSEKQKLNTDARGERAAVMVSDDADSTKHATDKVIPKGNDNPPASNKDDVGAMSATLHDGTLVIPCINLCQQMSAGVRKSFSDVLMIISQWRTQTRQDTDHGQYGTASLIYVFSQPLTDSFDIGILRRRDGWFEQPVTLYKLYHTLGTSGCSYVKSETIEHFLPTGSRLRRWRKLLSNTFSRRLKNHVGTVDEAGTLQLSKQPTTYETLYDFVDSVGNSRNAQSERQKDTNPSEVRYTPLVPTDNKQGKRNPQEVQKTSMHDQIASTMKLAGALYEVSTMLNEEISNTASQKGDDISLNQTNSDMVNEANPVFKTMKNGEIDVDAVQKAMAELKARLRDHNDKAQMLARVCRRWKEKLETRYPLMKRKSAPRKSIDNNMSPCSASSTTASRAIRRPTSSESDQQMSPGKVRYTTPRSESILTTMSIDSQEDPHWSPAKLRYMDLEEEVVPPTTMRDPREDVQSSGQQGKPNDKSGGKQSKGQQSMPSDERDKEQPSGQQSKTDGEKDRKQSRSPPSSGRKGGRDDDDGFSIFAL
jgi:hypothetical protein